MENYSHLENISYPQFEVWEYTNGWKLITSCFDQEAATNMAREKHFNSGALYPKTQVRLSSGRVLAEWDWDDCA